MSHKVINFRKAISDAITAALATFSATLAASSGAALLGFIQGGASAVARTVREKLRDAISILDFSAASVTLQLQAALTAAGGGGAGKRVVNFDSGAYALADQGSGRALTVPSNTTLDGRGAMLTAAATQAYYLVASYAATQVTVRNMHIEAATVSGTNDAKAGILFSQNGLGSDARNLIAAFNYLKGTSWGLLASAESGTEKIYGYLSLGNFVDNDTLKCNDGDHVSGATFGSRQVAGYVRNRGDAALAVTMTTTYQGNGATVVANVAHDCQVGIDFAGPQKAIAVGNVCHNTVANAASNPATRTITYGGLVPKDTIKVANIFLSNPATSSEYDAKIDVGGANDVREIFSGNITKRLYIKAQNVTVGGNLFQDGAQVVVAQAAKHVTLFPNHFAGTMDIYHQGPKAGAGTMTVHSQGWDRTADANFLPNYTLAPFWEGKAKLVGWRNLYSFTALGGTAVSSSVATYATTAATFNVDEVCLIAVRARANLSGRSAWLAITDAADVIVWEGFFAVTTVGTAENDKDLYQTTPTSGGTYLAKLTPGSYKLKFRSDFAGSAATLTGAVIEKWN